MATLAGGADAAVAAAVATATGQAAGREGHLGLGRRLGRALGGPAVRASGAPASVFGPAGEAAAAAAAPRLAGFCSRPDGAPACPPEPPCCCWSTFAAAGSRHYPDPSAALLGRRCLNPPAGFAYAPEPGNTHDNGHRQRLLRAGEPVWEGRTLCCIMDEKDAERYSMREPSYHINRPA